MASVDEGTLAQAPPSARLAVASKIGRSGWSLLLAGSALAVLVVVFAATSPVFLTMINLSNVLRQLSTLLVVGLAGTFVIMLGSIDLSVGSIVSLSGITVALETQHFGLLGALIGIAAGVGAGLITGLLHAYVKLPSFLVTLGMLSVVDGLSLMICHGSPVPLSQPTLDTIMGGVLFGPIPTIAVWSLGIWVIMCLVSSRTVFGRHVVAIGDGERVARLAGIPVNRVKLTVFVVSGALSAIGGLLLAVRTSSGSPGMGAPFLLESIAAVVMGGTALTGGVGGPARTLLGALTITVLDNGMTLLAVDPFLQEVVFGGVIILAVCMTIRRGELGLIK